MKTAHLRGVGSRVFDTLLDATAFAYAGVILAGLIYVGWRERQKGAL